jgi:hypothetical protein
MEELDLIRQQGLPPKSFVLYGDQVSDERGGKISN